MIKVRNEAIIPKRLWLCEIGSTILKQSGLIKVKLLHKSVERGGYLHIQWLLHCLPHTLQTTLYDKLSMGGSNAVIIRLVLRSVVALIFFPGCKLIKAGRWLKGSDNYA